MKATTFSTYAALAALACAAPAFAAEADAPSTDGKTNAVSAIAAAPGAEEGLRLNFRGVSLETVLNYMSDAAGYIINVAPGTDVKGKVEVWSNTPMSKEEAVQLLNTVLNQNNLTAVRTGRTLTIMNRTDGKTNSRTPVKKGNKPEDIEATEEMVTQIIPVQFANAAQLVQNLQPLLPEYAQTGLSANESGNALILTANKTDVRRMVEIVSALDTAIGSVSTIRVFPLKYADAKELVNAVKELFTPPAAQNQNNRGGGAAPPFLQQMFGGGGPGGSPFGGGGGPFGGGGRGAGGAGAFGRTGGGATGNTSQTAARVVAVADERSNSLIVAAADDSIPTIEKLVKEIDVPVDDITELRVYPLVNSDPNDIVTILSELFPDETNTTSGQGRQVQFGGRGGFGGFGGFGGGGGGGGNRGAQTAGSERMKKQGKVVAVAEERTSSVIVSAARDLMPQIEAMIKQIDSVRAKQKRVHVIPIKNADVSDVESVVREMFDRSGNGRNTAQQNNALTSRAQQNIQQQGQNTGGFGGQGGGATGARFGQ